MIFDHYTLFPATYSNGTTNSNVSLTTDDHRYALYFAVPETGDMEEIAIKLTGVVDGAGYSIQTINNGGLPSGTVLRSGTLTTTIANHGLAVLSSPMSVTRGERFVMVLSRVAGNSLIVNVSSETSNLGIITTFTSASSTNAGVSYAAGNPVRSAVKYTTLGWKSFTPHTKMYNLIGSTGNISSTTALYGNKLTPTEDITAVGVFFMINSFTIASTLVLDIFNGTTLVDTFPAIAGIPAGAASARSLIVYFPSDYVFTGGQTYRLAGRLAQGQVNYIKFTGIDSTFGEAAMGSGLLTQTVNTAGTWVDTPTEMIGLGLLVKPTGGGGGATGRYKAKVGGSFVDIA